TRKQNKQRIPFIRKFNENAHSLKEILDAQISDDNVEVLVNQITTEFDAATKESERKGRLQELLNKKKKELKKTESKLKENKEQITRLLKSINGTDRQDFRKIYEENNKVKELIKSRKNAVITIEMIAGLDKSDEVIDFLKKNDKQDIDKKVKTLANGISENSTQLNDKNTESGKKKNEIEQIEGESELAEVMTELESEKQKLQNAYKDWVTYKIALKILADVKEKYEKEKQPEVIKNSSTHFNKITGERYKRISVSLDERDVSVFDSREASKKIAQLSRGTKEQLLISLRLGFIEEYEKKAEPLPVIVDEVFVNFDPNRAKRTAEILHEFGENRQILIFTCQPITTEYFNDLTINLIRM
ncbi:MAG: ATP-binding protein, partial [Candidatus Anammoxibacter sp.]